MESHEILKNPADTFERSCEHWSEAGRAEMEGFYSLASVDYKYLAEARDWKHWLETRQKKVGSRCLRLLDIACGSGKFPQALVSYANVESSSIAAIDYALLDPSGFSIAEAREALTFPFKAGMEYQIKLQELECGSGMFDIVWATHALYAVPLTELKVALEQMINAIRTARGNNHNGVAFIAHANAESHYIKFLKYYLSGFKENIGTPYTTAEQIISILNKMGLKLEIQEVNYVNTAPQNSERRVESYLQRCLFDDAISLREMLSNRATGPYLEECLRVGIWQFKQKVSLIFITP